MSEPFFSFCAEHLCLAVIQERFLCLEQNSIPEAREKFTNEKRAHPLYPQLLFRLGRSHFQPLVFFLPGRLHRFAQDGRANAQFRHMLFVEGVVGLKVIDLRSMRK